MLPETVKLKSGNKNRPGKYVFTLSYVVSYSLACMCATKVNLNLPAHSGFIVALAAVNRSAFARLKRHLGILATLGAYCGEHLARPVAVAATRAITLCLSCLAASRTPLGLVGVAFRLKELLLLGTKGKASSAIGTF